MRGYIIKKAVHTGTHLSAFVNMVQCQGIACDHNHQNQKYGHHATGNTLNTTFHTIVYNKCCYTHE